MAQLEGVRVVDLTTFIAAPSAGRILAGMGAEVIKIEPPRGDGFKPFSVSCNYPAYEEEGYYTGYDVMNFLKKGLCLNLKNPEAMEILKKLLATADIFLTNNRVQALKKMGLDYETLHKEFPRLIHASILGYGEKGPLKDKPGFDYTAFFSRGGVASSVMEKGTSPAVPVSGFGDNYAGLALTAGILAALYNQSRTGEGERVTVSLYDTAIYGISWMMGAVEYGNELPASRKHTNSAVATTYRTKEGRFLQLAMLDYTQLPRLAKALDADFLLTDERFNTYEAMLRNIEVMVAELEPVFAARGLEEWNERLTEADIPFEIVQTAEEVVRDEQAWANDYIFKKQQRDGKNLYYVRTPIFFTERPSIPEESGRGRAPMKGEDTREILRSLGYADWKIDALKASGALVEEVG
ncbi:MAG: CoA transferase [Eubacteriales bacterium]|nr:CoA transferase [Sarcina sp.]MBR2730207.1 CoA transferase [Lachnospiraceae bacterium]MDO4417836.1 CoA transferase [Eubacteriales bacterium]